MARGVTTVIPRSVLATPYGVQRALERYEARLAATDPSLGAALVGFDNTASGLSSSTIQAVLDELATVSSLPATSILTIAAGVVTATTSVHAIDTEAAAASDDLNTINFPNAGLFVFTLVAAARNVVFKHAVGNLFCPYLKDVTLDKVNDYVFIYSNGTNGYVLSLGLTTFATGGVGAILGSTASGEGATLVAIEDPFNYLTAATVEAAISEIVNEERDAGSVASAWLVMTNQPADTNTVDIGADRYEFVNTGINNRVAADANIAVVIGAGAPDTRTNFIAAVNATIPGDAHPTVFRTDGVTPAHANGTSNLFADAIGNNARIRSATIPGGTVTPADPNLALVESIADAADVFNVGNVNMSTLSGRARTFRQHAVASVTVTANMITNGFRFDFTFTPSVFQTQVFTATNSSRSPGGDSYLINGNGIAVTFAGGAPPNIQANDVLVISVWGV